jgi:hypothetical protein
MEKQKQQLHHQRLQRAQQHGNGAVRRLHRWWLAGSSLATDHLRTVIILSVFGFKVGWNNCRLVYVLGEELMCCLTWSVADSICCTIIMAVVQLVPVLDMFSGSYARHSLMLVDLVVLVVLLLLLAMP